LADNLLNSTIYMFKAERLNIGESQISTQSHLSPDASNLPTVLHYLHSSNPRRFKRYTDLAQQIFPEIKQITAPPINNQTAQILIGNVDPETEQIDLAIPLSMSGTGISQVLAILYIIVTSQIPRIIIIDEPQ